MTDATRPALLRVTFTRLDCAEVPEPFDVPAHCRADIAARWVAQFVSEAIYRQVMTWHVRPVSEPAVIYNSTTGYGRGVVTVGGLGVVGEFTIEPAPAEEEEES